MSDQAPVRHEQRKGDQRYRCRYCNKPFVVATMTTHHEDNLQCAEARLLHPELPVTWPGETKK